MIKEQRKEKDRNKTSLPLVRWKTKSHWKEEEERAKIDSLFARVEVLMSPSKIREIKGIFLGISFMFAD